VRTASLDACHNASVSISKGAGPVPRRLPEHLVRTAERLFAENGIDDGVSLRQIAAEAGYRSPAAVQYHFGSKAVLLQAIVEYRLPSIAHRRVQLLEELDRQHHELDVRRLVEVLARPFFELDSDAVREEQIPAQRFQRAPTKNRT
jgi:AcrR family transcriptional regulator